MICFSMVAVDGTAAGKAAAKCGFHFCEYLPYTAVTRADQGELLHGIHIHNDRGTFKGVLVTQFDDAVLQVPFHVG